MCPVLKSVSYIDYLFAKLTVLNLVADVWVVKTIVDVYSIKRFIDFFFIFDIHPKINLKWETIIQQFHHKV